MAARRGTRPPRRRPVSRPAASRMRPISSAFAICPAKGKPARHAGRSCPGATPMCASARRRTSSRSVPSSSHPPGFDPSGSTRFHNRLTSQIRPVSKSHLTPFGRWRRQGRQVDIGTVLAGAMPPRSPELNPVENVWQFTTARQLDGRRTPGTGTGSSNPATKRPGRSRCAGAPAAPTSSDQPWVLVRRLCPEVVISFPPVHTSNLSLLEQKTNALDAPLAGWLLPPVFGDLRRLASSADGQSREAGLRPGAAVFESFSLDGREPPYRRRARRDRLRCGSPTWCCARSAEAAARRLCSHLTRWRRTQALPLVHGGSLDDLGLEIRMRRPRAR